MDKEFKFITLAGIFVGGLLAANMLGGKVADIFGFSVSVGIFAYPLTFLMTDAITEVYGKKRAKQVFWSALITQILVLFLIFISVKLPPASRYLLNEQYTTIFNSSLRMIIASLVAFSVSQTHDIWAFEFWKTKTKGKFLWLRNNFSTIISQALDTLLFMFIAFYGISDKFTTGFILQLSLSYWSFKVLFALLDTPFVYLLVKWLKNDSQTSN